MSFVYRYISDPKEFCQELSENKPITCDKKEEFLPLSQEDSMWKLIRNLDEDILSDYDDILKSDRKSAVIISQAKDKVAKFTKWENNLKSDKSLASLPELERINRNAQIIASLEYQINYQKSLSPKCFLQKNKKCSKEHEDFYKDEVAPLEKQKALLLMQNPILAQNAAQEFIKGQVEERFSKHADKYSENHHCQKNKLIGSFFTNSKKECASNQKLKENKESDISFEFSKENLKDFLGDSLKTAINSAGKLKKRHQHLREYIEGKLNDKKSRASPFSRRVQSIRKKIFHDREITTDYYLTLSQRELGNDKEGESKFICNIVKENEANQINANINSIALDAAALLIPLGGPFLFGKGLSKLSHIKNLESARNKSVVFAEAIAIGLDTENLSEEYKYCRDMHNQTITLEVVPDHIKDEYEKCKDTLNDITMSYSIAMLGGILGIAPSVKKIMRNKSKLDGRRVSSRGSRRGKDVEQRAYLNNLESELGVKKLTLLNRYNRNNSYQLDDRDNIYLAGLTEMLEKDLKATGKADDEIYKIVNTKVDDIMKNCKKVKK